MKKGLIILCLLLIPVMVFASVVELKAGVAMKYDKSLGEAAEDPGAIKFPKDFGFGADVNFKVLFFDVDATAYFGADHSSEEATAVVDGLASVNAGLDFVGARATLGAGFGYVFNYKTGDFRFKGVEEMYTKFIDQLKHAPINIRAAVDFSLDKVNIGIFGIYNTNQSFARFKIKEVFDNFNWENIQVGAVARFKLI